MSRLPLTEPELSALATKLGRMLLNLPVVSGVVGHVKPEYTIRDYLQHHGDHGTEFLIDLFSRPTPEILLKWYPRIEAPEGALFWFPGVSTGGGPCKEEMLRAQKALNERGEEAADYPPGTMPSSGAMGLNTD